MNQEFSRNRHGGVLKPRRMLLAATIVAGLGGALVFAPNFGSGIASQRAQAQNLTAQVDRVAKPVGFADIVEKVKPAVISVRVKRSGPGA
jgi:serine protease Do